MVEEPTHVKSLTLFQEKNITPPQPQFKWVPPNLPNIPPNLLNIPQKPPQNYLPTQSFTFTFARHTIR